MNYLDTISPALFEILGLFAGLSGCLVLLIQIIKEYRSVEKSSLSMVFIFGFMFIYFFWAFYGLRFHTIALLLTNSVAFMLQSTLLIVVVRKNRSRR
jgi:uncharacterized protein with PQ loop repeat